LEEKNQVSYFFVKVNLPEGECVPGRLPWMPTLIVFESDAALKGVAVFTSWANAHDFSSMMAQVLPPTFTTEIIQLGDAGMPLTEFTEGLINATNSMRNALVSTPVYVDPPDLFCKGISVTYNSVQRFMRRAMRDQLDAMCEHLSFDEYNGFTIALHKRKADGYFGCTCFRGRFTDAERMNTAIEDAQGTTLEKYHISTEFFPLRETAPMMARAAIDQIAGMEPKKKIIV
jgi:hypothetical protein